MNAKINPELLAAGAPMELELVERVDDGQPADIVADELVDRAEISNGTSLIALSKSEHELQQLAADHATMKYDVTDPVALDAMRQFRMRCSGMRTALKANCLELRAPAKDFAAKVLEAERGIEAKIKAIEAVGDKLLTDYDAEVKAERQRKADAAAEAAKAIDDAITAIRSRPNLMMGKPAAEVEAAITVLDAIEITEEEFGKKMGAAYGAKLDALEALRTMHSNAVTMEEQQRVLAEGQAKLAAANATQRALDAIAGFAMQAMGQSSATIELLLEDLAEVDVMADVFADRSAEALAAVNRVKAALETMRAATLASEARAAEQKAQQDALDAKAAEQTERQAVLDKAEADRKAEENRQLAERNQRAADIQARIDRFTNLASSIAPGAAAVHIESVLRTTNDTLVTIADFGDRQAEGEQARLNVMDELRALHSTAVAAEEAAALELEAQREERTRVEARILLDQLLHEAVGDMHDCLRQWRAAEASKDKAELAAARKTRDALLDKLQPLTP